MRRMAATLVFFAGCTSFGTPDASDTDPPDARGDAGSAEAGDSSAGTADHASPDAADAPEATSEAGGCPGAEDCERVVFITSQQFFPDQIESAATATAKCNAEAAASTHARVTGRKFRAWISDETSTPAKTFVKGTRPYVRPSGTIIAASWATFASAMHLATMNEDVNGEVQITGTLIWTGTRVDGTATDIDCNRWSTRDAAASASRGQSQQVSNRWTQDGNEQCTENHRIYCVEK